MHDNVEEFGNFEEDIAVDTGASTVATTLGEAQPITGSKCSTVGKT